MYNADLAYLKIEIKNMYHKCFNSYDNTTVINDQEYGTYDTLPIDYTELFTVISVFVTLLLV